MTEVLANVKPGPEQGEQHRPVVRRNVKELIGTLMRALDQADITIDDVLSLEFGGEGELLVALNETFIELLAFAHDRDRRLADPNLDQRERAVLQDCLNRIVRLCDRDAA
jgi:hypothetical protein